VARHCGVPPILALDLRAPGRCVGVACAIPSLVLCVMTSISSQRFFVETDALPSVRTGRDAGPPKRALLYRLCIEKGLLSRSQIAPNTFSRLVGKCSPSFSDDPPDLLFPPAP